MDYALYRLQKVVYTEQHFENEHINKCPSF